MVYLCFGAKVFGKDSGYLYFYFYFQIKGIPFSFCKALWGLVKDYFRWKMGIGIFKLF